MNSIPRRIASSSQRVRVINSLSNLVRPLTSTSTQTSGSRNNRSGRSGRSGSITKEVFLPLHHTSSYTRRSFRTRSFDDKTKNTDDKIYDKPGSKAFAECETDAIQDLFFQFAKVDDAGGMYEDGKPYLCLKGIRDLLSSIGEKPDEKTIMRLFQEADLNGDGKLDLHVSLTV